MPTLRRYTVTPRLPAPLERLREIAYNLWWSWAPIARELFVRVDADLWEEVHGNPIELLARADQRLLDELAKDDAFLSHLDGAYAHFQRYMQREGWFSKSFPQAQGARIAYFSMEFGIHESLPIYSGGLGVLAGDHLKAASDLGLPLVGIGIAYAEGYFRQVLNDDGWQGERYPLNDWHHLPVQPVTDSKGERLVIHVQYPDRIVHAQLWRVQVGRVPLFLLDANLEANAPEDRAITGPLYGGDKEFRVRQEIMLGIGGIHALEAMGLHPTVCHMNEGHSAFLSLERIRRTMTEKKLPFSVAKEACAAGNVFTTHTPVPAGIDIFDANLVRKYLEPYRQALNLGESELLQLGRGPQDGPTAPFSMPVLAIKTACHYNGVAALHGHVSRHMWKNLWPDLPDDEVPIGSVTNGIHTTSFVCDELGSLYSRYVGPRWSEATDDPAVWARVQEIPDGELWAVHEHRRHRLVRLARARLKSAAARRGAGREAQATAEEVLDPRALTIGFARRFATYKRATLLFSDPERVKKILTNPDRPVQLVFSGKAHPQDTAGKEFIRKIVHLSRDPAFRGRVVFLEDYDMRIARAMVSGVDVWLNTPRRPMEASGTSGMKAAANGVLNLSVLDGWWAEAFHDHGTDVGWAIGQGEEYVDAEGDRVEAELLYDLLEREVVPLFFDRDPRDQLPRGWIRKMKNTIAKLTPAYNTHRMVKEYSEKYYGPSIALAERRWKRELDEARSLVDWKLRVQEAWPRVGIRDVLVKSPQEVTVGDRVRVEALVDLGPLSPKDVVVELYFGRTAGQFDLSSGRVVPMEMVDEGRGGVFRFVGEIPTEQCGAHAFAARIMPANPAMAHRYETTLVRWA